MGRSAVFLSTMLFVWEKVRETSFSVVRPHAALAENRRSPFHGGQMDDCVVDAAAAETAMGGHKAGGHPFCHW